MLKCEHENIKDRDDKLVQLRAPAADTSERAGSDQDGGQVATVGVERNG